jgi:hypothetical protein
MTRLSKFKVALPTRQRRLLGAQGPVNVNGRQPTFDEVVQQYQQDQVRDTRCLLLFDATSSMQPYWDHVCATLRQIVDRLLSVHSGINLKVVAYRDDCDGARVIEASGWSGDPETLTAFVGRVPCSGGGDRPEAVDRALNVAVAEKGDVSAIILIGDSPPHEGREGRDEARQLGMRRRPVYPIVVGGASDTTQAFAEIAHLSGGKMVELNKLEELYDVLGVVLAHSAGPEVLVDYMKRYDKLLTAGGHRVVRLLTDGK